MPTQIHTMNNRLLIVDDNPAIHEDFRRILSPSDFGEQALSEAEQQIFGDTMVSGLLKPDFQIAFASQGEEAVVLAKDAIDQDRPFAAAIVDVRMPPGIDGIQTVKRLWRVQSDLQIIVCTAYSEYSWEEMVEEIGVSHRLVVLKKPFDPIEVMQLANAMTKKWGFERDTSLRQIDLQSKLLRHAERIEQVCQELHTEREAHSRGEAVGAPRQSGLHYEAQQLDAISSLASGIAHDFNNALTVIQSHLTLPFMDRQDTSGEPPPLETVLKAVQRASSLTKQIMAFTSHSGMIAGLQRMSLREQAAQHAELLVRTLGENVQVKFAEKTSEPLNILADEAGLSQVVVSLALQCREGMPDGGSLAVSVEACEVETEEEARGIHALAKPGSYGILKLTDSHLDPARGRSQERSHNPDQVPDRVSMAEGLLARMGGWLTVRIIPKVGCEYAVFFPLASSLNEAPSSGMTAITHALKVLVVDDEPAICDVVSYVLTQQGHIVIKAHSATEAWTIWQEHEHRFQLVISDIHLPEGITGLDLCAHMKQDAPLLPVIYTSGYHPEMFGSTEELTVGFNFLPKPFDVIDLLNATGRALEAAEEKRSAAFRQPLRAGNGRAPNLSTEPAFS